MYFAIIGDIISSKKIKERHECQQKLDNVLSLINCVYEKTIASKFLITLGDEFQGLLLSPEYALDIIERISFCMYPVEVRFGIGKGEISTGPVGEYALGSDGSAYHRARSAIEEIKTQEKRNRSCGTRIKFAGPDDSESSVLNAIAVGLYAIEKRWTNKQRELIALMLFEDLTQESVAERLGITQSSVNRRLKASGYYDYFYMKNVISKTLTERSRHDE
ncbi:MAG: hypothetical protein IKS19_06700 [Clostridia bacterium]|nr:hypothetical protein [Clostridia bacterium]